MSEGRQARAFAALLFVMLLATAIIAVASRVHGLLVARRNRRICAAISDAWLSTYRQGSVVEPGIWASFPPAIVVEELARVRGALTDEEDLKLIAQAGQASRVQKWLLRRAHSRARHARASAAEDFGFFGTAGRITSGVLKRLIADRDESVRVRAIRGMARQGLHVPLCHLLSELDDGSREGALLAADAILSGICVDGAAMINWPAMAAKAQGKELILRCIAMRGLAPDISIYEEAALDSNPAVRAAAVMCAGAFFTDEPLDSLKRLAESDPDPRVRDLAIRELSGICGRGALPEIERALLKEKSHLVLLGAAESACRVLSTPDEVLTQFGSSSAIRHVVELWRLGVFRQIS
jgi:hypothetical protein